MFIIQFLLTYLFFFFSTRTDPLITIRTELHCTALHCTLLVQYRQLAAQNKNNNASVVVPPSLCCRQTAGNRPVAPCSREPDQPNSQKCVLRCVEVPGAHLTEGDPRAGVSCSSFLLLILHSHGRRHIAFTTGEVEHTSRRSINRTCEFKGRREAATGLKSVE